MLVHPVKIADSWNCRACKRGQSQGK